VRFSAISVVLREYRVGIIPNFFQNTSSFFKIWENLLDADFAGYADCLAGLAYLAGAFFGASTFAIFYFQLTIFDWDLKLTILVRPRRAGISQSSRFRKAQDFALLKIFGRKNVLTGLLLMVNVDLTY